MGPPIPYAGRAVFQNRTEIIGVLGVPSARAHRAGLRNAFAPNRGVRSQPPTTTRGSPLRAQGRPGERAGPRFPGLASVADRSYGREHPRTTPGATGPPYRRRSSRARAVASRIRESCRAIQDALDLNRGPRRAGSRRRPLGVHRLRDLAQRLARVAEGRHLRQHPGV